MLRWNPGLRIAASCALLLLPASARALDGRALLASSAKMTEPAGWNDRRAIMTVESFADDDKVRERRIETKESLGEDLKISALSEFLGPADVLGLRVLDVWAPDDAGGVYVWTPDTRRFQRVPSGQSDDTSGYGNEPSYRDAQLLDLLPRMADDIEVEIADEATVDGVEMAVLDVDVGDRQWPMARNFRVWVSREDGRLHKIEARKRGGAVARTVTVLTYADADGRPTATKVEVETAASARKTIFTRSDVEYDRGLPERIFSLRDLSKGR